MRFLCLKTSAILFLALLLPAVSCSRPEELQLDELDRIIENPEPYEARFHARADSLKEVFVSRTDMAGQFHAAEQLFDMYRNYRIDSALILAERMGAISQGLDSAYRNKADMYYADAINKFGRHGESVKMLDRIPRTDSVKRDAYFYYLYHTAYLSLAEESKDGKERAFYRKKMLDYKDTLIGICPKDGVGYVSNYAGRLSENGRNKEALAMLTDYYDRNYKETGRQSGRASLEYQIAEICLLERDTAGAMEFLKRASVSDLKEAKKVYKSLQRLAALLYARGDIDHAYSYIIKSLQDINEGHARYRVYDITGYLPIITASNDKQMKAGKERQVILTVMLAVLVSVLVVAYWMVSRRNRSLAVARTQEEARNEDLLRLTADLRNSNADLKESDRIKVEYIALLFNTYSEEIKHQESFRRALSRKIAARQPAEALKLLDDSAETNAGFKRFIARFDTIFLSIFPNFVADFNNLLRPEEQIVLKKGELLTPELRIYALIRLGITENARIADFLHYSLQTVYNYRQRMRNKALVKGQSLSAQMRKIAGEM